MKVRLAPVNISAVSLRRKEAESILSRVAALTAVSEAPEPENEVAVKAPVLGL